MSYTYSGNPKASPTDAVHYELGNTNPADPIATDEECLYALDKTHGNVLLAAAEVAETKALTFAMRTLVVSKGARMGRAGDPAEAFRVLAATLRMRASLATTTVYAGGISVGDKDANRQAADIVQPFARKDLHTPFRFTLGVEALEREP